MQDRVDKMSRRDSRNDKQEIYHVVVAMEISKDDGKSETSKIDFGKLKEDQVRGLTDLFSMMAANVEYIKKLTPQFEKMDKSMPDYLS